MMSETKKHADLIEGSVWQQMDTEFRTMKLAAVLVLFMVICYPIGVYMGLLQISTIIAVSMSICMSAFILNNNVDGKSWKLWTGTPIFIGGDPHVHEWVNSIDPKTFYRRGSSVDSPLVVFRFPRDAAMAKMMRGF